VNRKDAITHASRANQAALAAAKMVWPATDAVNRHGAAADSPLFLRHKAAIVRPVRGSVPYVLGADIHDTYGPNQQAEAAKWADEFLGLYWLVARRRCEFERDCDDWAAVRRTYADRLSYYATVRGTGMTLPSLLRVLERLRDRGGPDTLEEMALVQMQRSMEPRFTRSDGGRVRCESIGGHNVSTAARPEYRDYEVAGIIVPQVGRYAVEKKQIIREV